MVKGFIRGALKPTKAAIRSLRKMVASLAILCTLTTSPWSPAQTATASGTGQPYCKIDPKNVYGDIGELYKNSNAERGVFSCPVTSDEQDWYGGRIRLFSNGVILWVPFPDHRPILMWVLQETWNTERTPFASLAVRWEEDANRHHYEIEWKEPGQDWQIFDHNVHGYFALTHVRLKTEYQFRIRGCDEDRCFGWLPPIPFTTG